MGTAIRRAAETVAEKAAPIVKKVTDLNTLVLCALLLWLYRGDIFSAVGTYAIGSQLLCYALLGFAAYLLGSGLSYEQKAPMVLGICTRKSWFLLSLHQIAFFSSLVGPVTDVATSAPHIRKGGDPTDRARRRAPKAFHCRHVRR